jgi:diguanylate cyclase (GGDEF)-like protein
LTGLGNRRLLSERLEYSLLAVTGRASRLALLFLDLDRFKCVNDSFGHAAGDELLRTVARRLRGSVRDSDTVVRLAGDEFVLLLPTIEHIADAERVAQNVLALLDRQLNVSVSIGVAVYPLDGLTPHELLDAADAAMYEAKRAGGSCHRLGANSRRACGTERGATRRRRRSTTASCFLSFPVFSRPFFFPVFLLFLRRAPPRPVGQRVVAPPLRRILPAWRARSPAERFRPASRK